MATSISINTLNDSTGVNDFFTASVASNYTTIQNFLIRASTMRRILASTSIGNTFTDNSIPFPKLNGTIADTQIAQKTIYGSTPPTGKVQHIADDTIGPGNLTTDVIYWSSNAVGINVAANNATATLNVNGTFRSQNATFVGTSTTEGGQISLLDPVATSGTFGGWELDNNAQNFRIFRDRLNPSPEPTVEALSISKAGETTVNDIKVNAVRLRQTGSVADTAYGFFGTSSLANAGFYYDTTNSAISIASNGTEVARFSHSRTDTQPPIRFFQETVTVNSSIASPTPPTRSNRIVNTAGNYGIYNEVDSSKFYIRTTNHLNGFGTTGSGATQNTFIIGELSTGRVGFGGDYGTDVRVKVHGDMEVTNTLRVATTTNASNANAATSKNYVDGLISGLSTSIGTTNTNATNLASRVSTLEGKDYLPVGVIVMWSGSVNNIPTGWALCNGTNGTPNLTNRFVVGATSGEGVGTTATAGPGFNQDGTLVTAYTPGNRGGAHCVTLTTSEMPVHSHGITDNGHAHGGVMRYPGSGVEQNQAGSPEDRSNANQNTNNATTGITINNSGGTGGVTQAHENRPPYYALCFIMKT